MKVILAPVFPVEVTRRPSGRIFSPCTALLPSSPLLGGWFHDTPQQTSCVHTLLSLLSRAPALYQHPPPPSSTGQTFSDWRSGPAPWRLLFSELHNRTNLGVALASECALSWALSQVLLNSLSGAGGEPGFLGQAHNTGTFSLTMEAVTGLLPAQREASLPTSTGAKFS